MKYTIDESVSGLERQRQLAQTFSPSTVLFLDEIGDLTGVQALDLGCGIGETTRMLGKRIGTSGSVVGVDLDQGLVESAESMTDERNISYTQGDAHSLTFDDGSFDVVYARLLLLHVSEPIVALKEMLRVCRPQGTVIVHDGDFATLYTAPDPVGGEGLNKMFTLFRNTRIGTGLWQMFRQCGYDQVELRVDRMLVREESGKRLALMTVEAMREAALQSGLMTRQEVDALCQTLSVGTQDDSYLIGFPEMYAAWVKR
jgi:SAM-dependent methyltransferase